MFFNNIFARYSRKITEHINTKRYITVQNTAFWKYRQVLKSEKIVGEIQY